VRKRQQNVTSCFTSTRQREAGTRQASGRSKCLRCATVRRLPAKPPHTAGRQSTHPSKFALRRVKMLSTMYCVRVSTSPSLTMRLWCRYRGGGEEKCRAKGGFQGATARREGDVEVCMVSGTEEEER
jgi:hypothetical protein